MTDQLSYALAMTIMLPHIIGSQRRKERSYFSIGLTGVVYLVLLLTPLMTRENWIILVVSGSVLVCVNTVFVVRAENRHLTGSLLLILNLIVVFAVVGSPQTVQGFAGWTGEAVQWLSSRNRIVAEIAGEKLSLAMFWAAGLAAVTLGLNDPIAFLLKRSHLMPGSDADPTEPARGKVIGYLERGIILILMLTGNIGGIGLVLAAKGFTRFKQLDDRDFAEYVLIGTLLSVGATMVTGLLMAGLR